MDIEPLGDSALIVRVGVTADEGAARAVQRLAATLTREKLAGVTDIVPSYTTIGVYFDPMRIDAASASAAVTEWVKSCAGKVGRGAGAAGRDIVIPVCFAAQFGPDLEAVASAAGMTEAAVVAKYCAAKYQVRAIGFVPGFGYLSGLPVALQMERRGTPRTRVPAGSVGIGGAQTGVYPLETPGGWNLIGRTPLRMFGPEGSMLRVGDTVRFTAVSEDVFGKGGAA